ITLDLALVCVWSVYGVYVECVWCVCMACVYVECVWCVCMVCVECVCGVCMVCVYGVCVWCVCVFVCMSESVCVFVCMSVCVCVCVCVCIVNTPLERKSAAWGESVELCG